jgi:threonine aldolase
MFDLSKGLGAPIGAVLAGSETFVDHAEELRNLFGGGLRQAGVVAGPGLVALSNVDRLAEDHRNAERLASELAELDPLDVQPPETNIVLVDVSATGLAAEEFVRKCEAEGVRADLIDDRVVRFCTYSDVDRDDVTRAASAVRRSLDAT